MKPLIKIPRYSGFQIPNSCNFRISNPKEQYAFLLHHTFCIIDKNRLLKY